MELTRKPFQGVWNIIRFNWQFYVGFVAAVLLTLLMIQVLPPALQIIAFWGIGLASLPVVSSLCVSWWVYDASDLYDLRWLSKSPTGKVLNINAGFDETSELISQRYPTLQVEVCDFYDPKRHTEVSIKRARKAYPQHQKAVSVTTAHLPFPDGHFDACIAVLSAHEIRDEVERINFFKELKRVLSKDGKIYVTEHLRDLPNLLAYSLGVFHFHSPQTWRTTFQESGLTLYEEIKTTPFVSTFILTHGTTS